jgi:peptide/nickel transport system substrate-binding protein
MKFRAAFAMTKFRAAFATIGLMLLPLLAAPAMAKDDLVIGVAQFPSSLHPDIDAEVVKDYVIGFALRPITAFDPAWKNSCLLCAELPTLANGLVKIEDLPGGGKGLAVTLKLRPGLKWDDGVPVTTKDMLFTWKIGKDPASGFSNPNAWSRASSIDVIDDHTAVIHLPRMDVSYNQWDQLLPAHIEEPIYDRARASGDYIKQTAYNRAPTTPGLYDGPYRIASYQSGVQVVLEPNPYWPGRKPGFKHIVIKLIANTAALEANLLSGDVDMVAGEGIGLTIDQVLALRKQHPGAFIYEFKPSLTYEHIDLQRDNPVLQDIRVRRALIAATDRRTLVSQLFAGMQPVAATWVNPLSPYYDKAVTPAPYDPARAKSLLAAAGWKPGSDGICRNAAGQRLSLEISTTSGNNLRELTEQVLQSQWKAAGIEVTLKNEPPRTLFGETLKQREYTGMAMYAWSSGVTESPRRTLGSDQIPTARNNWGGSNYVAFSDPTMDSDIAKAETELDPVREMAIWAQMQKIYAEQAWVLPLFFRADTPVLPKWLKGYTDTGQSDMGVLWAENWRPG